MKVQEVLVAVRGEGVNAKRGAAAGHAGGYFLCGASGEKVSNSSAENATTFPHSRVSFLSGYLAAACPEVNENSASRGVGDMGWG